MTATIKDVARQAGVSPSTVSRVLNQKGKISDDTRSRIFKAMEELKYIPNDFARSLATGSPKAIALVIDVSNVRAYANSFFNNTVFGIETTAHRNDYNLIIANGAEEYGGVSSVEKLILGKKIDGVILPISIVSNDLLAKMDEIKMPCVILGHPEEVNAEMNWIDINNVQAGSRAVKLLLQNGYERIAFLSDGDSDTFNMDRITGYCRALSANGLTPSEDMIVHGEAALESGIACVTELLRREPRPDAVICSDDRLALGALRAAARMGLKVPQDFGIISFDNTAVTELAEPGITSIDVDTFELGLQAAELLINQVRSPELSLRQILLSTKIIERESTRRVKE